jgi:hypothetical protein
MREVPVMGIKFLSNPRSPTTSNVSREKGVGKTGDIDLSKSTSKASRLT